MSSSQNQIHHQLLRSSELIQHQVARDIIKKSSLREPHSTGTFRDKLRSSYEFQSDNMSSRIEKTDSIKSRNTRSPKREEDPTSQKVYKTSKDLQNLFKKTPSDASSKPSPANESHLKEKIRTMIYDRSTDRVGVTYSQAPSQNPYRLKLLQESSSKKSVGPNESGWLDKTADKDKSNTSTQHKRAVEGIARQRSAYFANKSRDVSSSKKEDLRTETDDYPANSSSYSRAIYLPSELIRTRKDCAAGGKTFSRLYQPEDSKSKCASRSASNQEASLELIEEQAKKICLLSIEIERMTLAAKEKDSMMLEIASDEQKNKAALCREIERLTRETAEKDVRNRELQEQIFKLQSECAELAFRLKPERNSIDSADGTNQDPYETIQVLKETIAVISKDNEKLTKKLLGSKEKLNSALCEKDKIIQSLRSQVDEVVPSVSSKHESNDNSTLGGNSVSRGLLSMTGQDNSESIVEENKRLVAILAEKESVIEQLQDELKNQPLRRNLETSPTSDNHNDMPSNALERWIAIVDKELTDLGRNQSSSQQPPISPFEEQQQKSLIHEREQPPAPVTTSRVASQLLMNRIDEVDEEEESEDLSKKGLSLKAKGFITASRRFEDKLRQLVCSLSNLKREVDQLDRLLLEKDAQCVAFIEELRTRDELITKMHERISSIEVSFDAAALNMSFSRFHTFGQTDTIQADATRLIETPKWASEDRSFQ